MRELLEGAGCFMKKGCWMSGFQLQLSRFTISIEAAEAPYGVLLA